MIRRDAYKPVLGAVFTVALLLALTGTAAPNQNGAAPQSAVAWSDNLNGALARAQNEYKPLLAIFTSPDCPWCQRFKRETLTGQAVLAALEHFICVEIDTTRDQTVAQQHQIRRVPATLILSGDGRPQWGTEGFMDRTAFLKFIDVYRQGDGKLSEGAPAALDDWLKALREKRVRPGLWPEIVSALGDKVCRSRLHAALIAYTPVPRQEWVELLVHPKLAVRLGAFELLEELAGSAHGYDPWSENAANREALSRWRRWATSESESLGALFTPLTESQIQGYIRDLASDDRERSARAVRMLERAGEGVIPALDAWQADDTEASAVRRVKEVRYFLQLPESLGTERARLAHRLVFGNQNERLRSLESVAKGGSHSLPVLTDFLFDLDPFIREAAVDAVISADRQRAATSLLELLQREREEAVIHAVVRGAGRLQAAQALELAGPFLTHDSEDLVVAALASLSRTKSTPSAKAVVECLQHRQWRVRAAALEALARLNVKRVAPEVDKCLEDDDLFVRRTAVFTLATLQAQKSAARLSECFLRDDQLKGPVVAALREMDMPLPESFASALRGKDADVLLPVLDALGRGSSGAWRLALPYLHHDNGDVACAAIRVVARGGGRESEAQTELAKVLRSGSKERIMTLFDCYPPPQSDYYEASFDLFDSLDIEALAAEGSIDSDKSAPGSPLTDIFAAFANEAVPPQTASPAATAAPPIALNDLFDAFGARQHADVPTASDKPGGRTTEHAELLQEALACLDEGRHPELRLAAALSLSAMGNERGTIFLRKSLDLCTTEERLKIARRAGYGASEATDALIDRLLRDPSADVRRAAVRRTLKGTSNDRSLQTLLRAVFERASPLQPIDLLQESYVWYRTLRRASARRILGAEARRVLVDSSEKRPSDAQLILALALLDACWRAGDQNRMQDHLAYENPFVRRAAWLALGRNQHAAFLKQLDTVAQDTSEWVRAVVPSIFMSRSSGIYFDATTHAAGLGSSYFSSSNRRQLDPSVVTTLTTLCRDPAMMVRNDAALCLLANRQKLEFGLLTTMIETAPDKLSVAAKIGSLLKEVPLNWLREQNNTEVLRLLDGMLALTDQATDEENTLRKLRRLLMESTAGDTNTVMAVKLRQDEPRPAWSGTLDAATATFPVANAGRDDLSSRRLVVVFRNPGCRDCARVEEMLRILAADWAELTVEIRNIRNPEDARINEALCRRFEVPVDDHLTTPAVFCGAGALLKKDITFERLQRLLCRPEAATTAWRELSKAEKEMAGERIESIYSKLTPLLIFGAGLADGVNPCAFATIIFLLSYLQLVRRKPRELLAVGGAFMAGVFLAYFALGLGLVEVVERFALLQRFALLFHWGLAIFVAIVALLNFWDGVQCLRGKMGDMILQLPGAFKSRIHDVVRHSVRRRRFVWAAFLAGIAISLLELACTGQVYAPTLFYVMKAGLSRRGVLAYLLLYNVAFVVPLAIVFCGAYSGLRSERLTQWLRRRAAVVKFATALLFTVILVLLIFQLKG